MSMVTVYNKTDKPMDFLLHGERHHIEATSGEHVGQIVVSDKRSKEMLSRLGNDVTLNRGDLTGVVDKDNDYLRKENAKLAAEVLKLSADNKTLKDSLQDMKDDVKRAMANKKIEEKDYNKAEGTDYKKK